MAHSEFTPYDAGSMVWKINRERLVLLAGPAAAVLQVAHPQVAMGVAAHSKFRTDSAGRLSRTLKAVYAVAFGTAAEVEGVRRGVAAAHGAVRGAGYSAFDPDAQLWVLATLIMGSVTMYERFIAKLTPTELDQFLAEHVRFGEIFGLSPEMIPTTWPDFLAYWNAMNSGPLLGSHPLCAEVAGAVLQPAAPWYLRCLSPVFVALTLECLPAAVAGRLKIPETRLQTPMWRFLDRLLPAVWTHLPRRIRFAPQYLQALKRA